MIYLLSKLSPLYQQLDLSPKWNEIKSQWPEAKFGPVATTGEVLLSYNPIDYDSFKSIPYRISSRWHLSIGLSMNIL